METASSATTLDAIDALVVQMRAAEDDDARELIAAQLLEHARGPHSAAVRQHLDEVRRGELLEVQWAIEEVLDAVAPKKAPPPAPEPEPEPEPEDPNRPLSASDLNLVYDDPRGLMLHKSKTGERWFATQIDPRTQSPQTFELHPQEVTQLKQQLAGSPYWLLGG